MLRKQLYSLLFVSALSASILAFQKTPPSSSRVFEATAVIKPVAPKTGENTLEVTFMESSKPVIGLKLVSNVGMTNMDMGTAHPVVKETAPGHYTLKPMFLMDGPWRVTLVSKDPKFVVNFDMTSGAKGPWKSAKQTIKIGDSTVPTAQPKDKTEPPKTEPKATDTPKKDPVKTEPSTTDPAKQEPKKEPMKMDQGYEMAGMGHVATSMPQLKEKSSYVWTGNEEWETRTGFGKLEPMVKMMILMMVGGSGMEGMKMLPMDMVFNAENFTEGGDAPMKDMPMANSQTLKVEAKIGNVGVGDNNVAITVTTPDGKPVTGAKVTTAVAMTNMDMGTTHPAVKELGKGKYAMKANFSMNGPWRLTLVVSAPGMQPQTYSFDFEAK
ncbi:MAG: FixH family protein [Armatimonadetes bacterium]|nr:FixH family protein [Armatimonadota bacterium]